MTAAIAGVGYTPFIQGVGAQRARPGRRCLPSALDDAGHGRGGGRRHRQLHGDARLGALSGRGHAPWPFPRLRFALDLRSRRSGPLLPGLAGRRPVDDRPGRRRRGVPGHERPLGGPGRHHAVRRDGGPVPLPDRLRRLPDVRGHVGPAVPVRDRPGSSRPGRGGRSPSASYASRQRPGLQAPARSTWTDVPGRALRRRAVPGRRLHRRGRRRLRRRGHLARTGPRPPPTAGGRRLGRLPGRAAAPASTSATTCSGPTTPATTPQPGSRRAVRTAPASAPATSSSPRSTTASPAPC